MSTDEQLIKSGELIGQTVSDRSGGKLGTIREVFICRGDGTTRFVVLELASLFGGGGKYHPLPWRLLQYDSAANIYVADVTKDRLKESPAYDRDQLSSTTYGWSDQVSRFFDVGGTSASPAV